MKVILYIRVQYNVFYSLDGSLPGLNNSYKYFQAHLKKYNNWYREHEQEAKENGLEELPIITLHGLRHSCVQHF